MTITERCSKLIHSIPRDCLIMQLKSKTYEWSRQTENVQQTIISAAVQSWLSCRIIESSSEIIFINLIEIVNNNSINFVRLHNRINYR